MPFPPPSSLLPRRGVVQTSEARLQRISNERLECSGEPARSTCSSFSGLPNLTCQRAMNPSPTARDLPLSGSRITTSSEEPIATRNLEVSGPPAFRPFRVNFEPSAPKSFGLAAHSDRASSWPTLSPPSLLSHLTAPKHRSTTRRQQHDAVTSRPRALFRTPSPILRRDPVVALSPPHSSRTTLA